MPVMLLLINMVNYLILMSVISRIMIITMLGPALGIIDQQSTVTNVSGSFYCYDTKGCVIPERTLSESMLAEL